VSVEFQEPFHVARNPLTNPDESRTILASITGKGAKPVALVLCTGIDASLLATRRLILESAGHKVFTATDEKYLLDICKEQKIDVAVVGQAVDNNIKRRIASLIRTQCPKVKLLELYEPHLGRALDDADSWLLTPTDVPKDLADRVDELAKQAKPKKRA
jgi:hypothetical protein